MQEPSALGRAVQLVRDLRKRCPWDAAQTAATLRPYLVEEAFELDHALGTGAAPAIRDELGDLLLHLAFQIVLAEEAGTFGAEDVVETMERKMWRRHPQLFRPDGTPADDRRADDHQEAPERWERAKLAERGVAGPGLLDGLPPNLPALVAALRLQERAAGVGFDWPDARGPADKVREELGETEHEIASGSDPAAVEREVGDLLFAVINLARKLGCDARAALEKANARFVRRFRTLEELAGTRGMRLGYASLDELDALWNEVKDTTK